MKKSLINFSKPCDGKLRISLPWPNRNQNCCNPAQHRSSLQLGVSLTTATLRSNKTPLEYHENMVVE